mgnify:CR=1 FL=1
MSLEVDRIVSVIVKGVEKSLSQMLGWGYVFGLGISSAVTAYVVFVTFKRLLFAEISWKAALGALVGVVALNFLSTFAYLALTPIFGEEKARLTACGFYTLFSWMAQIPKC